LPARAARQLPDQSTTLRVESSSTDDPRLRGALPTPDIGLPRTMLSSQSDLNRFWHRSHGTVECADEAILARKGLKRPTRSLPIRPTGTKAKRPMRRMRQPRADLEQELESCRRELAEAREQQRATSEVLQVISSSPSELEPVFQTMLGNAVHVCEAKFGSLLLCDGDLLRPVARHNQPPELVAAL
jgi:hypothetical protein